MLRTECVGIFQNGSLRPLPAGCTTRCLLWECGRAPGGKSSQYCGGSPVTGSLQSS